MSRMNVARRSMLFVVIVTLLSVTAVRAATTITFTGPPSIFYFSAPICIFPLICGDVPNGTFVPNLNAFTDASAQGILVTGLTLTYTANPADDGKLLTLKWTGSRPFDAACNPTPCDIPISSHLDGSFVYDQTKFLVTDIALVTNVQDFSPSATQQIGPVLSGIPFDQTTSALITTNPDSYNLGNFFAITFQQINATNADTITLFLPNSAFSAAGPPTLHTGPPTTKDECKKDGWKQFDVPRKFKNQGDCVSYVNTGK